MTAIWSTEHRRNLRNPIRKEALQAGNKTYIGKPCGKCQSNDRETSTGLCFHCRRIYRKAKNAEIYEKQKKHREELRRRAAERAEQAQERKSTAGMTAKEKMAEKMKLIWYGGENAYPEAPPYDFSHRAGFIDPSACIRRDDRIIW